MATPTAPAAKRGRPPLPTVDDTPVHRPYVPADTSLPEMTVKAILLGAALSVVLGAANMYVGLRVGLTVSASIPAAVMSMGILRMFKEHNILENNIVQTFAASGQAVAAGIIFTIPALLLIDIDGAPLWANVNYWETLLVGLIGGTVGVLFTVPLRRAFIVETGLQFPEGVACGEVLKAGEGGGRGAVVLGMGILVSAGYSLLQGGLRLWGEAVETAGRVGSAVIGVGTNLTPILLGVGYIVGLKVGFLIFLGGAIAWFGFIPLFMTTGIPGLVEATPYPELAPLDAAYTVWTTKIRLVGGGAMVTGGLYTLWKTRDSLRKAFTTARAGSGGGTDGDSGGVLLRTDRDMPVRFVAILVLGLMVPVFLLYQHFTGDLVQAVGATLLMGLAGFFFAAVAGYMAGVVGSSNNPISGVTILTLITASILLVALGATGASGILAALGVGAVICTSAALSGDTLQDLKTGHIVGSTPWKQQLAQVLGVVAFAGLAPLVLQLLVDAYGFLGPNNPTGLAAPQAFLMAGILEGIFSATLDWNLVFIGMALGVALILLKLPVMPVAVGVYLPLILSVPILLGGVLNWFVMRRVDRRLDARERGDDGEVRVHPEREERRVRRVARVEQTGLLFASGLIAGEAIMGIFLAGLVPFEPTTFGETGRVVTARLMPLFFGLLVAGGLLMIAKGRAWVRWLAVAAGGVGLAGTSWLTLTGYAYAFTHAVNWPGVLVFAYVALLVAWFPLREARREPEDDEAVAQV